LETSSYIQHPEIKNLRATREAMKFTTQNNNHPETNITNKLLPNPRNPIISTPNNTKKQNPVPPS
jgi:hypothetical protein